VVGHLPTVVDPADFSAFHHRPFHLLESELKWSSVEKVDEEDDCRTKLDQLHISLNR